MQMQSLTAVLPGGDVKKIEGHTVQLAIVLDPVAFRNEPGGQLEQVLQDAAPGSELYLPAAHEVHPVFLATLHTASKPDLAVFSSEWKCTFTKPVEEMYSTSGSTLLPDSSDTITQLSNWYELHS